MGKLKGYFEEHGFTPNDAQRSAIEHIDGPLLIVAGPGSGKTRVLLWRAFNLIVFHGVKPSEIFLSTFTEKAAKQLKDGLLTLLGSVQDQYFDTSDMYVGTVHSLCRRILADRHFNTSEYSPPELMDKVDQYFHVYDMKFWPKDMNALKVFAEKIAKALQLSKPPNKHRATEGLIAFFNRLSEECITPEQFKEKSDSEDRVFLADLYHRYLASLTGNKTETNEEIDMSTLKKIDMSLLQRKALIALENSQNAGTAFKYVLIDEYQDTNRVQESIFFEITQSNHNLCVVGDDDQALYRFRGATVENIVQFEMRCQDKFKKTPEIIHLDINYRSRPQIVKFYNSFIATNHHLNSGFRLPKNITADRTKEDGIAVVTSRSYRTDRFDEIAGLVKKLIDTKKVSDANQIAFLYPSVKPKKVEKMIRALDDKGLAVYSPRSNPLLSSDEAKLVFGLLLQVFDKPEPDFELRGEFKKFCEYLDECKKIALEYLETDQSSIIQLIAERKDQLAKIHEKTNVTWNLLDLFYEFCACDRIRAILTDAEQGNNELAVYNLSQISQYIARYQTNHKISVIESRHIQNHWLSKQFFNKYLYGLFRLGETEYEDQDNPFPKGKIPFLTIHQAKGLEFQVVVLGDMQAFQNEASGVEKTVRPLLGNDSALEPIESVPAFDAMRMFYVALSRAQNLLVLAKNPNSHPGLQQAIDQCAVTEIPTYSLDGLPKAAQGHKSLPKTYSYTADYQSYLSCPRHYMLFRKYSFAPARSRTMAFGVLVHKTIEDIHRRLLDDKQDDDMEAFISERFKANYQTLLNESSHQLSATHLEIAKQQALHYWKKNEMLARKITHTEVPLTLPGLKTQNDRIYSMYGVVDMAEEGERLELYDIKTHAAAYVRENKHLYQEQLNVYAKIWQDLHKKSLDGISVIATKLPNDSAENITDWNPIVELDLDQSLVDETIKAFGGVVDAIELQNFHPRSPDELYGTTPSLAAELCSSCDGRFSCASYSSKEQSNEKEITKEEYLRQEDVKGFTNFLKNLVKSEKDLNHSYFVPTGNSGFPSELKGTTITFKKLRDAFTKYYFGNKNYDENKLVLDQISNTLRYGGENKTYEGVLECLRWGAGYNESNSLYTNNKNWIDDKKAKNISVLTILEEAHSRMTSRPPDFSGFDRNEYRMNSGFTKIYALKFDDFTIYDGRVGAAFGLLVRKYIDLLDNKPNEIPILLSFPWGRGQTPKTRYTRNPSDNKYTFPELSAGREHAKWNIRANWILKQVASECGDFWGITDDQEKLRALEAALFMIGYAVSIKSNKETKKSKDMAETQTQVQANSTPKTLWGIDIPKGNRNNMSWQPTGHNFDNAIRQYQTYKEAIFDQTFESWLIENDHPRTNSYVANRHEFDLPNKDLNQLRALADPFGNPQNTKIAKAILLSYKTQVTSTKSFYDFPKILMCVYFLVKSPNNVSSAQFQVGKTFGRHYGFLDEQYQPTEYFREFFMSRDLPNDGEENENDRSVNLDTPNETGKQAAHHELSEALFFDSWNIIPRQTSGTPFSCTDKLVVFVYDQKTIIELITEALNHVANLCKNTKLVMFLVDVDQAKWNEAWCLFSAIFNEQEKELGLKVFIAFKGNKL